MRVRRDEGLQVGWFPVALQPPELACVFVVKATFALRHDAPLELLPEGEPLSGDLPAEDGRGGLAYASDFVPFKPRADVLLRATAHAPGGHPVSYLPVGMRVGTLHKKLLVVGDRVWKGGLLGKSPGDPTPFATMPLLWERALGGADDPNNPAGVGRKSGQMPNVEWPDRLLRAPGDRIEPAGFAPIAAAWEPRRSRVGTYGGNYVKTRWPWYPADLEWSYFSCAPADQQIEGHLRGDEELQFDCLHRQHGTLRARLPGRRARCFATLRGGEFRGVDLKLDTLFADLENDRIVLVWRGFTGVTNLRLPELESVFATLEPLGSTFPDEHYRRLRDAAPPQDVEAAQAEAEFQVRMQAFDAAIASATKQAAELEARVEAATGQAEAELLAQEQMLLAQGVDPKLLAGPLVPQDLATARAEVEGALAQVRLLQPDMAPPPEADEGADEDAEEAEGAQPPAADPQAWTRERVVEALQQKQSLGGAELAGLDLSGLDFTQCDLGAALLAGADLSRCRFERANLERANLSEAKLAETDFAHARLDRADLTGAAIANTRFAGASLQAATLEGLALAGCDFHGCTGRAASFAGSDLAGCNFGGASLPKANFGGCTLADASFAGADLQAARFGEAKALRIDCTGADLRGLHGGDGCDFSGAIFRKARLGGAILAGAVLDDADFGYATMPRVLLTEASLRRAELSRADLAHSVLDDANLTGARLLQTNLLYCAMERVDLTGADLRWANLYGCGLWQAKADKADLRNANLRGTLLA